MGPRHTFRPNRTAIPLARRRPRRHGVERQHVRHRLPRSRADHLHQTDVPLLFLQGTRDKLAPLETLEPVCRKLGARATLHVVEGADHSFHVLVRSGRTDDEVLEELAATVETFCRKLAGSS